MITAEGLSFSYGATQILRAVDLAAEPGRVLGLIGPNGSGKTTLLRLLYGALRSTAGTVRVDGEPLPQLSSRQLAGRVAVVVQESGAETSLTVAEMVLLGRNPHLSTFARPDPSDHRIAAEALDRVGARGLASRAFAGLSGGERQRVLIARALAQQASHLLLDEPTNHLDIRYQHEVLTLVADLAHRFHTTVVVVLHDLNLAARYCDDLVLLDQRRIAAAGPTEQVLVPEILEPVYQIGVQCVTGLDSLHLIFSPTTAALEEPA